MLIHRVLSVLLIVTAGVAWAHEDVKNPAVLERMEQMSEMGAATKVLGQMARGQTAFDAAAAEDARAKLVTQARRTIALFEARQEDPKDEAKPAIWEDFADFSARSDAMITVALAADVGSLDALRASVRDIGRACAACHEPYRE